MLSRKIPCVLIPLVLAAAVTVAWRGRSPKVSASLHDLVGRAAERVPKFIREASSSEVAMIVSSRDGDKARRAARKIRDATAGGRASSDPWAEASIEFVRANRAGLVTAGQATLLETAEGRAKVARRAMRRLYVSPVAPVLGYADDPFGLTDDFLKTIFPRARTEAASGFPVCVTNGVTHLLVKTRLSPAVAANLDATIAEMERLRLIGAAACSPDGVTVRFAGAPVHAAAAAARSKREIGALTWFSLAVIAGLAFFAFRSIRWLPLLASSLTVSSLAGTLVLVLAFKEIHVMTLVMGTTVLGLVVDYSFHWLLSTGAGKAAVRRGLFVSFVTTEISLIPLMLSSIPVLRQSALFLGAALAAALAYVLLGYPDCGGAAEGRASGRRMPTARIPKGVVAVLLAVVFAGLGRMEIRTEAAALYKPAADLQAAESVRAAFESIDLTAIPSLGFREKTAAAVEKLYSEHGAGMAKVLGLERLRPPSPPRDLVLEPRRLLDAIFGEWTREAVRRLGGALLALLAGVAVLCRRRFVRTLLPPLVALAVVAGGLGWAGVPVNLFHLLAAFLLLGMGIDYAVFLGSGESGAFKPALCSLLTSVAGFGALAFVSFPVVRSFGVVLGLGLPVAFVTAMAVRPAAGRRPAPFERAASPLGLECLFLAYRIFGLRALHFLASAVGACVWVFSPSVRRASPRLRKVANFTRSLADKLVVMAEGKELPLVETDGSPDAAAFEEDVRKGRGVFILSSHLGTIEVLTALGECDRTFHAWMDVGRTGVFNRFYLRHAKRRRAVIHPISGFGLRTVFEAGDWIDAGECLVMAGDRGEGAFRFAAAFDHPVYFVACLAERGLRYRAVIRRLPSERKAMKISYDGILHSLVRKHPDQHFAWDA